MIILLIVINLFLIFDCIRKTILIKNILDLDEQMSKELSKLRRENKNLMAVIENDDKIINEMKEGKN